MIFSQNVFNKHTRKLFLLFLLFFYLSNSYAQTLCNFDSVQDLFYSTFPASSQDMGNDEQTMQEMMENHQHSIMNGATYVIPVVFHILHKDDEAIGTGSNISKQRVIQALQDLNDHFSNAGGGGIDVGIQFCLAQQDPNGNSQFDNDGDNITGIQRISASSVPDFDIFGL